MDGGALSGDERRSALREFRFVEWSGQVGVGSSRRRSGRGPGKCGRNKDRKRKEIIKKKRKKKKMIKKTFLNFIFVSDR